MPFNFLKISVTLFLYLTVLLRPVLPMICHKLEVEKEISSPKHSWLVQQLLRQSQKEKEKIPATKIQLEESALFHVATAKINFNILKVLAKYYDLDQSWHTSNYDLSFFQPPEMS